ncbi:MAG: aspartate kinase [Bacteroidota bacterium]
MLVFKFGGASVKNASAVKNVAKILRLFSKEKKVVVISAMGKTTNLLEEIVLALKEKNHQRFDILKEECYEFHLAILNELFSEKHFKIYQELDAIFEKLDRKKEDFFSDNYAFEYDQIVSLGEVISTLIVDAFLREQAELSVWVDARKLIRTDHLYRDASVDWKKTEELIVTQVKPLLVNSDTIITQGFVGHTSEGFTTTLGREGSDYTAGIFAYCLNAQNVTIWKDVPGMLNADPKWFDDTIKLDKISFKEAIELAYYGASVIHPKTIKPLQNKNIPLYVKSFVDPNASGTVIQESAEFDHLIPSFIFKMKQVLFSITPRDFSFIVEENLSRIFDELSKIGAKINLMQNSALSFSFALDQEKIDIQEVLNIFHDEYEIRYNQHLELVTIRHYNAETIERVTEKKEMILEQKTRQTIRILMKDSLIS